MVYLLGDLAKYVGCKLKGDPQIKIDRVCTLYDGKAGGITFLANRKYARYLETTRASAVILRPSDALSCPVAALIHDNPYVCYARVAGYISRSDNDTIAAGEIHPSAVVDDSSKVGEGVILEANVVIGANVSIGNNSRIGPSCVISDDVVIGENVNLHSSVTIYKQCVLGCNVLVHAGTVIGSDGFGIAQDGEKWVKVPQLGRVIIGDNVEIGASTTIDRGAIEDTIIGDGVKLDNQIQIGHNVRIGEHTAIAGCTGIAGSAEIGCRCTIGGMGLILGHLKIADDVHLTAQSMVTKSVETAGVYSSGTPLQTNATWKRSFARFTQLDDIAKRLKKLEQKFDQVKQDNKVGN